MQNLKKVFAENWGYLIIPLVMVLGIVWVVGAVGTAAFAFAEAVVSIFPSSQ